MNKRHLPDSVRSAAERIGRPFVAILETPPADWTKDQRQAVVGFMAKLNEAAANGHRSLDSAESALWEIAKSAVSEYDDQPIQRRLPNGQLLGREDTVSTRSDASFRDQNGREVRVYGRGDPIAEALPPEYNGLTFGNVLRALVTGPRSEAERRALSEGTTTAGGYTVPVALSAQFFDLMRAKSVCARAGMQTVMMDTATLKLAKLTGDVPAGWRNENTSVATGDPTFGAVDLTARSLAGMVTMSRELVADSVNADAMLATAIAGKFAAEIDRVCLVGTGTPPQPKGIKNQSGVSITYTGTNGGVVTMDQLLDLRETLETSGNQVPSAYVMAPRTRRAIAGARDSVGQWVALPGWLLGQNVAGDGSQPVLFLSTSAMPINETRGTASNASSIIAGQFASLILGLREQVTVQIVPGLGADSGQVNIIAHARGDCAIVRATDFAVLSGVTPS